MEEFEIIGPNDQPALLAISTPEALDMVKTALTEMGYKVHVVETHRAIRDPLQPGQLPGRRHRGNFRRLRFLENPSLHMVQNLPMSQRRHAVFFLIGPSMETLNTMQAFALSVHCVINYSELPMLSELVQKTVAENDMFLATFRDVQRRVYQKSA
jgi:hypothetical protein